ncbi:TPA: porin family protein, partial [Legionella pneumophila]|nr:porin family protein [Legionella pneumophila]
MKYRLFLSVATAGVLGSTAFAGTMGLVIPSKDLTWVGSIAAGPIWARSGETQTFYLAPEIEKTYAARISTN